MFKRKKIKVNPRRKIFLHQGLMSVIMGNKSAAGDGNNGGGR